MSFQVTIPSLNRENIIKEYTLSTLLGKGIKSKQIEKNI